jgi:two-component system, chemotaxis family, CheB/CheR fusion protein
LFHFALRDGGRLFLGGAETIGRGEDLFETLSKKWRVFRRKGPGRGTIVEFPLLGGRAAASHRMDILATQEPPSRLAETARRVLVERYAPASVLVDRKGAVQFYHGDTSDYLKQPPGAPTRDLLAMVGRAMLAPLRAGLRDAFEQNHDVRFNARVRHAETVHSVRITIAPMPGQSPGLALVSFEPRQDEPRQVSPAEPADVETSAALELELKSTRAELQGTIEQLEGVNEELKASNEEATSINEELQSTNEELETSKEELQSFNEELHSINSQLQHKIAELDQSTNDLSNLLSCTEIATLFLDMELRVKWFSPATRQLFDLVTSDVGRPLRHFARKFEDERLLDDADTVLARLTPIEAEIQSHEGRWFTRRVLPYRTLDNRIGGIVITFVDITDRKGATDAVNESRVYAEAIVATARQPLVVLNAELRVRSANRAFYELFNIKADGTEEHRLDESAGDEWKNQTLIHLLNDVLSQDQQFQGVEIVFGQSGPEQKTMLLNARKLTRNGGREDLILLAIEDVTDRKHAVARQDLLIGELNHRVKNVLATVQAIMNQTRRQVVSLEDFMTAFEGRLHALAQAHDLLATEAWTGTEIGQLVSRTLEPYRLRDTTRVVTTGPNVAVRPQAGVALVMIFHELATNAAKYGALSVPAGKLTIRWHRDGNPAAEQIRVRWVETEGPKVTRPARRGFGTRLIERSATNELGGEALLEYLADGFRCELIFPWASVCPVFDYHR